MRIAVGDTSPINYLILIEHIDLVQRLFGSLVIPASVALELMRDRAPRPVRAWVASLPDWARIIPDPTDVPGALAMLDQGERMAIALALSSPIDIVLMDERAGVDAARSLGLRSVGTIGVLDAAARQGLVRFDDAINRLARTSFRMPTAVVERLIALHRLAGG